MYEVEKSDNVGQLKRVLRYVKGTEDTSTVFEMRDSNARREQLVKRLEVFSGQGIKRHGKARVVR